jgi:hypothetical protein
VVPRKAGRPRTGLAERRQPWDVSTVRIERVTSACGPDGDQRSSTHSHTVELSSSMQAKLTRATDTNQRTMRLPSPQGSPLATVAFKGSRGTPRAHERQRQPETMRTSEKQSPSSDGAPAQNSR